MTQADVVIDRVCETLAMSREELFSPSRQYRPSWGRHLVMYLQRELYYWRLQEIADIFGMDHSTVHHGVLKVGRRVRASAEDKRLVEHLSAGLMVGSAEMIVAAATVPIADTLARLDAAIQHATAARGLLVRALGELRQDVA